MELRDRQQLDRVAELGRVGNVHRRDAGDAFDVHVLEVHRRPEGEVHQDRQLVGGVDALYVERRIGFRVARRLRFLQDFVERATGFGHLGQDVVRRAVDDPVEGQQPVGRQAFGQGAQDGNPAADTRFKADVHTGPGRRFKELFPVDRQQRLVGGDDVLALGHRLEQEPLGRIVAPDQLDDDVDRGLVDDLAGVRGEDPGGQRDAAVGCEVEVRDLHQGERDAEALADHAGIGREDLGHASPDGAEPDQADCDAVFHEVGPILPRRRV